MKGVKVAQIPDIEIDPVTLDIIEGALKNARHEMDAVLFRTAMSPVIREQHDEFPMITDPKGRMVVGQFGSYIAEMMRRDLPRQRLAGAGADLLRRRAHRLVEHVRPHDGHGWSAPGVTPDRSQDGLRRGDEVPAGEDLPQR
jgi:hypothetical protein